MKARTGMFRWDSGPVAVTVTTTRRYPPPEGGVIGDANHEIPDDDQAPRAGTAVPAAAVADGRHGRVRDRRLQQRLAERYGGTEADQGRRPHPPEERQA